MLVQHFNSPSDFIQFFGSGVEPAVRGGNFNTAPGSSRSDGLVGSAENGDADAHSKPLTYCANAYTGSFYGMEL